MQMLYLLQDLLQHAAKAATKSFKLYLLNRVVFESIEFMIKYN